MREIDKRIGCPWMGMESGSSRYKAHFVTDFFTQLQKKAYFDTELQ